MEEAPRAAQLQSWGSAHCLTTMSEEMERSVKVEMEVVVEVAQVLMELPMLLLHCPFSMVETVSPLSAVDLVFV